MAGRTKKCLTTRLRMDMVDTILCVTVGPDFIPAPGLVYLREVVREEEACDDEMFPNTPSWEIAKWEE